MFLRTLLRAIPTSSTRFHRTSMVVRPFSATPPTPPASTSDAKMHMVFTCGKCNTRAVKSFSKRSYETGVVIATCPGCEARHLVADNLVRSHSLCHRATWFLTRKQGVVWRGEKH